MTSLEDFYAQKIIPPEDLNTRVEALKQQGKTIATLNGSFDLLHAGHLYIIHQAAHQADILIVALNSDNSIKVYKGEDRPLIPLKERLSMMCALTFVDYVTWFEELDPINILSCIQPDVHVNGSEYGKACIEASTVEKHGGKLHLVKRIPGLATSDIINKIKNPCV